MLEQCLREVVRGETNKTQMTAGLEALLVEVDGAEIVELWMLGS